ncbi:MAG: septal ring lytic transglycosylase RlpA family protein [Gammaproteobacteria bacterium]|nr:septal ring lytic transglycosylase RlpA family protein [Gammaproteobacteria bacterium]
MRICLVALTAAFLLSACLSTRHTPVPARSTAATPAPAGTAKTNPYTVFGQRYYPISSAEGYWERGVASWYGGKFHGRKTANGERYDMHQLTAAHKTLPLPTWVRVTNLRNGNSVDVRVNDRGPFVKNRLIDVSYAAAMQLGMVESGTTLVEVEVLDNGAAERPAYSRPPVEVMTSLPTPAAPPVNTMPAIPAEVIAPTETAADDGSAIIFVQVGAFGDLENARRLQTTLYNSGISDIRVIDGDLQGLPVYRVQVGPVASVDYYDVLMTQLTSIGVDDTHLVTE